MRALYSDSATPLRSLVEHAATGSGDQPIRTSGPSSWCPDGCGSTRQARAAAASVRANASSTAATARGGKRSPAATRTSWPTRAVTSAVAAATRTFGNKGRFAPRARRTAAAPADATRAARPLGSRREGVQGSLSMTSSAATVIRDAVRARGPLSGAGKPGDSPSIRAAKAAVERSPVAAPATAARQSTALARVSGREVRLEYASIAVPG